MRAFNHDVLAGLKSFFDDPKIGGPFSHAHGLDVDFVALADDRDLVAALQFRHRALRHQQRVWPGINLHANAGELAGAQGVIRIRKQSFHPQCAGGPPDFPIGRVDLSFERIDRAVGENQFDPQLLELFAPGDFQP